jgi:hypothetical protein
MTRRMAKLAAHADRLAGVLGQIAALAGAAGDARVAARARRRAALWPLTSGPPRN